MDERGVWCEHEECGGVGGTGWGREWSGGGCGECSSKRGSRGAGAEVRGCRQVGRRGGAVVVGSPSGGAGPFGCGSASCGNGQGRWELRWQSKGGRAERRRKAGQGQQESNGTDVESSLRVIGEEGGKSLERVRGKKLGRTGLSISLIFLLVAGALVEELQVRQAHLWETTF